MSSAGIKQHFILPASPWWGGFYERLVRSVKSSLKKILGRFYLTYEELETILVEIESSINSRPLMYINEDDIDSVITPNHLIFGTDIHDNFSFIPSSNGQCFPAKRLRHLNKVLNHYRNRFSSHYFNELRQLHSYRKNPSKEHLKLVEGDIVLIQDNVLLPRTQWKVGKVESLVNGKDDHVRGAKLCTISRSGKKSTIHRPTSKLIPFELTSITSDETKPSQMVENCQEDVVHTKGRVSTRKAAICVDFEKSICELY